MDGEQTGTSTAENGNQGQGQGDQVVLSRSEYEGLQAAQRAQQQERQTMAQRLESLEGQYRSEKINATLGDVLAGQQFVSPAAAQQVRQILASRSEVRNEGGQTVVVDRLTGQPLVDAARAALDSPEFGHFIAPRGHRGSGATNPPPAVSDNFRLGAANPIEASLMRAHMGNIAQTGGIPGFGKPSGKG